MKWKFWVVAVFMIIAIAATDHPTCCDYGPVAENGSISTAE